MTTEQKRPAAAPVPAARPKSPSAVTSATQKIAPTAPKAVVSAGSPRAPAVAPSEPRLPQPSSPSVVTEVHSGMAPIAIEAALAELGTWRREAERKIARLEAEVAELQTAPRAPALAPSPPKEPLPPWAHTPLAPAVAPVLIPAAAATPASLAATDPAYGPSDPIPIVNTREAPTMPPSFPPRSVHAVYYDLDMRPGETVDLPSQLDAGRRKRVLGWLALLVIVGAMIALMAASVVSQR